MFKLLWFHSHFADNSTRKRFKIDDFAHISHTITHTNATEIAPILHTISHTKVITTMRFESISGLQLTKVRSTVDVRLLYVMVLSGGMWPNLCQY